MEHEPIYHKKDFLKDLFIAFTCLDHIFLQAMSLTSAAFKERVGIHSFATLSANI